MQTTPVPDLIARVQTRLNMTGGALARTIGVSSGHLSSAKHGRYRLSAEVVDRLTRLADAEPAAPNPDLFEAPAPAPAPTPHHAPLAELEVEATSALAAAGIDLDHLDVDAGWKRKQNAPHIWYIADSGIGRTGAPWLMVCAGDAKRTGDVSTPVLVWKSWEQGDRATDADDLAQIRRDLDAARARHKAQDAERRAAAREAARATWDAASTECGSHDYLAAKAVGAYGIRRDGDALLAAVTDLDGIIYGVQRILPDGAKRFNGGASVAGHCHLIGTIGASGPIRICEGYATGASIHQVTGEPVACAFNCGNLEPVARAARARFRDRTIIICGDDDRHLADNPGTRHAHAAAAAVGGIVVIPRFSDPASAGTDFNDLMRAEGIEAVRAQLAVPAQQGRATDADGDTWPDPEPLADTLPPVAPFAFDLLPPALRPWIEDVADRMQCPADYPGVAAMVALASVVGRQIGIRPKAHDDWVVVPNLWGIVIGRPSLLKTPAMQEALHPIRAIEARARTEHEAAMERHAADELVREAQGKEAKTQIAKAIKERNAELAHALAREASEAVEPPTRRRYVTQDSTVEKLGELLSQNPRGMLIYRDELVGFLRAMDQEGKECSRAFYLEAWNGTGGYTFDRIGRGTVEIEAACVSIIGAIQPGPLRDYMLSALAGGSGDDGLLQRFQLAVWPDVGRNWINVDRLPDTEARRAARAVFERLDGIDPAAVGAHMDEGDGVPWMRFDPDAQVEFDAWRADLEHRLRADGIHPAMESHLAKYRSLAPSLALLIHLAGDPDAEPVSHDALLRALAWCEYLETHARRIYAPALTRAMTCAVELARRLPDLPDGFLARDVYRKGWRTLDIDGTALALAVLIDHHHLRAVEPEPGPGRPATRYRIHPALREAQAA
ncbi:MAG: DUF3987 domain-containing protein [Thiocapsa sp.]|uniref:DUF3987 domain-containing protein n=1 Tax=Thiocapsa sp. TaxID=2024551 RepID=UPI001BCC4A03|nr:DUF3987 domain-containing protein [Thiocapsa sp.]QVL50779.1 MAG: DUF3987 domain-containing protein [Thiocapsa sp.]